MQEDLVISYKLQGNTVPSITSFTAENLNISQGLSVRILNENSAFKVKDISNCFMCMQLTEWKWEKKLCQEMKDFTKSAFDLTHAIIITIFRTQLTDKLRHKKEGNVNHVVVGQLKT